MHTRHSRTRSTCTGVRSRAIAPASRQQGYTPEGTLERLKTRGACTRHSRARGTCAHTRLRARPCGRVPSVAFGRGAQSSYQHADGCLRRTAPHWFCLQVLPTREARPGSRLHVGLALGAASARVCGSGFTLARHPKSGRRRVEHRRSRPVHLHRGGRPGLTTRPEDLTKYYRQVHNTAKRLAGPAFPCGSQAGGISGLGQPSGPK